MTHQEPEDTTGTSATNTDTIGANAPGTETFGTLTFSTLSAKDLGRIAVIGPGRLGASLARGLAEAGHDVAAVAGRRPGAAESLARRLGSGVVAVSAPDAVARCDLVFLTVPDAAIRPLAAELPWRAGQGAVHCSGALGLDVLAPAVEAGASAGCLHPLQSFASSDGEPERFRGAVCGVEGAPPLGERLERIVAGLGATSVRLEGVDRARYHAAAVFASNYAVATVAAAVRAWVAAGLPPEQASEALAPLLLGAAGNVAERDLPQALTGPVARGDVDTVERHLAALAGEPGLATLYRELGAELLRLDLGLDPTTLERLRELLGGG